MRAFEFGPFVLVFVILASCGASHHKEPVEAVNRSGCGIERWDVKTLKDAAAKTVDFKFPYLTSVADLNELPRPESEGARQTDERKVFKVHATLVKFKLENDRDIHAVISDQDKTLITELPDVSCTRGSYHRYQMYLARKKFEQLFGMPHNHWNYVDRTITIVGVVFFDFAHGQSGHADNYIELHPVLSIKEG